jgi:hypothetical protein
VIRHDALDDRQTERGHRSRLLAKTVKLRTSTALQSLTKSPAIEDA